MKKILALMLALALMVSIFGACQDSSKPVSESPVEEQGSSTPDDKPSENTGETTQTGGELNLFTWEGMFPEEVLTAFTEETGITINYSNFDYSETMLAKLQADKSGIYDLVIADDYIIKTVVDEGLAKELDTSKMPNFANINPKYQSQFYDPDNKYTVPYGSGVQTIVYDPALVELDIQGYEDLWNPKLADQIGIIGNYRVIDGAVLKTMSESYNTEDIAKIEAAGKKLLDLAPNIRVIRDDNLQNDLISGEISVGVMYTSQVTMAKIAKPDLKVVFPQEGIGFGIMVNFIPANAQNAENAQIFMDYILRPEVSAQCFEYIGYYCTNSAAEEFISEEYKEFLTLPADFSGEMEMIQPISAAAEEAHSKAWTEFKTQLG